MRGIHIFVAAVVLAIVGAIAVGLYVSGTPEQARREKLDAKRVSDLLRIAQRIDIHWNKRGALPEQLGELDASPRFAADPETRAPYPYRVIDENTYEICAVFDTACDTTESVCSDDWRKDARIPTHGPGRQCFELAARPPE